MNEIFRRKGVSPKPLVPGGINFTAMRLVFDDEQRTIRVKPSSGVFFLGIIPGFMSIIFLVMSFWLFSRFGGKTDLTVVAGMTFLLGGIFVFAAFKWIGNLRKRCRCCFDLATRTFYPNGNNPREVDRTAYPAIPCSELISLQIVTERCRGSKNSFNSYELNVITQNGERYNLLDHGGRMNLIKDAERIAEILAIPLTDAYGNAFDSDAFLNLPRTITWTLLAGAAFLLFGAVCCYFCVGRALYMTWKSRQWEKSTAVVTLVQLKKHTGKRTTYTLDFGFRYRFRGKEYTGNCYNFFNGSTSFRSDWSNVVHRNPVGKKIDCYVDPEYPERAVVDRTMPEWWKILLSSLWCVILLGMGIGSLQNAVSTYRYQQRRKAR